MTDATWPTYLTAREIEVGALLARGFTCSEIGDAIGISVRTVDSHRGNLLDKTGLREEVAFTRWAIRSGLVSLDASADAPGCTQRDTVARRLAARGSTP